MCGLGWPAEPQDILIAKGTSRQRSSLGKNLKCALMVTPPSRLIMQAEVPRGPSLSPVADRVGVQTHVSGRLYVVATNLLRHWID
jgi:hypothetical protein